MMNLLLLCNHVTDSLSSLFSMQSLINIVIRDIVTRTAAVMIAVRAPIDVANEGRRNDACMSM